MTHSFVCSIVVASKFTSDVFYPNARYAKVRFNKDQSMQ